MIFKENFGDIQKQCIPNSSFSICAMSEKKKNGRGLWWERQCPYLRNILCFLTKNKLPSTLAEICFKGFYSDGASSSIGV